MKLTEWEAQVLQALMMLKGKTTSKELAEYLVRRPGDITRTLGRLSPTYVLRGEGKTKTEWKLLESYQEKVEFVLTAWGRGVPWFKVQGGIFVI